jgi:hypothetical protein
MFSDLQMLRAWVFKCKMLFLSVTKVLLCFRLLTVSSWNNTTNPFKHRLRSEFYNCFSDLHVLRAGVFEGPKVALPHAAAHWGGAVDLRPLPKGFHKLIFAQNSPKKSARKNSGIFFNSHRFLRSNLNRLLELELNSHSSWYRKLRKDDKNGGTFSLKISLKTLTFHKLVKIIIFYIKSLQMCFNIVMW